MSGRAARILGGVVAITPLAFEVAAADFYVAGKVGFTRWPDTGNRHQLEASSSWTRPAAGVAAGWHFPRMHGPLGFSIEAKLGYQLPETHGRNWNEGEILESFNHPLHVVLGTINLWPEAQIRDSWTVYAGGGAGVAGLFVDGDRAPTMGALAGVGVRFEALRRIELDAGYRYTWTAPVDIVERRAEYDAHVFQLGVRWRP